MKRYLNYLKNNHKGQGTTEYIVILAIAMGIALTIFWGPIKDKLKTRVVDISTGIEKAGKD